VLKRQFTCFTGTKVQILTQLALSVYCAQARGAGTELSHSLRAVCGPAGQEGTLFTCFPSTKVQILAQEQNYLTLYAQFVDRLDKKVLCLLAFLVQKYKY
jgi:hypothetical protein